MLAGAGIGHLTFLDPDIVDLSNLHRQVFFTEADVGESKVKAAAHRCRALNGEITVRTHKLALTPLNAPNLVTWSDLVIDCADSYAASYTLSDVCLGLNTPLIRGSVLDMGGYAGGVCGDAPSLRAVFPDAPDSGASCATAGVLGPVVTLIGATQAQMALNVLLGIDPSPLGQMVQLDARTLRTTTFRFDDAPEPAHANAHRIAAQDLPRSLPQGSGRIALCCATGLRAWRAAETIQTDWPGEIVLVSASTS